MVLVTGASGFLGGYILQNLVSKGYAVRALVRSGKRPFFPDLSSQSSIEWFEGDVLDVVSLEDAMQDVDTVIHSAAIVSFHPKDKERMHLVNGEGTANVVNMAIETNISRFIHISSVAALGRTTKEELVNEEKKWQESPSNTQYSLSKHRAEMEVWRGFAEGLEGVILNPSTILGFGDWHQSSAALFRNSWNEFPWYTKGVNGFVGVEDVAEAAVRFVSSDRSHERFIVNAENWSFQKIFETIAENFGRKKPSREASPLLGSIAWRAEKIKSLISGKPALLTRETAKVAHSKTSFDNRKILAALPGFEFTPLETVIKNASYQYKKAMETGRIAL